MCEEFKYEISDQSINVICNLLYTDTDNALRELRSLHEEEYRFNNTFRQDSIKKVTDSILDNLKALEECGCDIYRVTPQFRAVWDEYVIPAYRQNPRSIYIYGLKQ